MFFWSRFNFFLKNDFLISNTIRNKHINMNPNPFLLIKLVRHRSVYQFNVIRFKQCALIGPILKNILKYYGFIVAQANIINFSKIMVVWECISTEI